MALSVGIGLLTGQLPKGSDRSFAQEYRDTVELGRRAESAGFDSVWVSEHHGTSDGYFPSLLVVLAAIAAVTERIELGTGVLLTPLHDPIRLAEDAATVDALSNGRLTLGLGLGWRREEFRMLRVPFDERLARHVETVEVLRRAWSGERFSFRGDALRYEDVRVSPPPTRPGGPPIVLGGYADAAVRRAGAIADGHIVDAGDAEHVRRAVALMGDGARSAGRDPAALRVILTTEASVSDDGDAWAPIRSGLVHAWGAYDAWEREHDTPAHDSLEPVLDEAEAREQVAVGGPAEVLSRLRSIVDPLATLPRLELVVRLHFPGMSFSESARAIERFGRDVLPGLRSPARERYSPASASAAPPRRGRK